MRHASVLYALVLLALAVSATPAQKRQDTSGAGDFAVIDIDAVWNTVPDPVYTALPLAVDSAKPSINTASVAASISAFVATATMADVLVPSTAPERRAIRQQVVKRVTTSPDPGTDCSTPAKTGSYTGPVPETDADGFKAYSEFHRLANTAGSNPPVDYTTTFTDLYGASLVPAKAWYSLVSVPDYSTSTCASRCNADARCNGFNLYFERDPKYDPTPSSCTSNCCPNPKAVTNSKCVLLGYAPDDSNAKNVGQWRGQFHVVIAGSNGYAKNSNSPPPLQGYQQGHPLGNCTVNGAVSAYMGYVAFDGSTDFNNCAVACRARDPQPYPDGTSHPCSYFTAAPTYDAGGQYKGLTCALYSADQSGYEQSQPNCGSDSVKYRNVASYSVKK